MAAKPQDPLPAGPFRYSPDDESVKHNSKVLESFDFDLEKLLQNFQHTSLYYGNEFRPIEDLESIYGNHDLFPFFKKVHQNGMEYKYTRELTPDEKMAELEAQLQKGNHKGAVTQEEELKKKLHRDIQYGFSVPVLKSLLKRIKGAMLQPCNLAPQFTLTKTGERVPKNRLTHDMSDGITQEDVPVNSRCDMSQYPHMIYGWALLRIITYIVALRRAFPNKKILISKYDLSDAYRRIANGFKAAAETILVAGHIAFIMLRLCFGASVNPPVWCSLSEMVTDLSNELPLIKGWNPDELHHPMQPEVPEPEYLDESIPITAAKEMVVDVPTTTLGRGDCFIDDIIKVFLDTADAIKRHASSALLAIFVSIRPFAGKKETVPRKEVVSLEKWKAEGVPREIQMVLGWLINTRLLLLCLPLDKYTTYVRDIDIILSKNGKINLKQLESIIGKLQHASYVIPLASHFLSSFRRRVSKMQEKLGNSFWARFTYFHLSKEELADLTLWKELLHQAHKGISLNGLTLRRPTQLGFSDSCPYGLGGFTHFGRAWRLKIDQSSPIYGVDAANNALEFLGMAITLLLSLKECEERHLVDEVILILGDNTSAVSWIFRASLPTKSIYFPTINFIARKIATAVSASRNFIVSRHLEGKRNVISDYLSFEGKERVFKKKFKVNGKVTFVERVSVNPVAHDCPPNDVITHRIVSIFPQLVPKGFKVCLLPKDLLSFAQEAVEMLELSFIRAQKGETRRMTDTGNVGADSAITTLTVSTQALKEYPQKNSASSYGPSLKFTESPNLIDQEELLGRIGNQWRDKLLEKPSACWLRRTSTVSGGVPFTDKETLARDCSQNSTDN